MPTYITTTLGIASLPDWPVSDTLPHHMRQYKTGWLYPGAYSMGDVQAILHGVTRKEAAFRLAIVEPQEKLTEAETQAEVTGRQLDDLTATQALLLDALEALTKHHVPSISERKLKNCPYPAVSDAIRRVITAAGLVAQYGLDEDLLDLWNDALDNLRTAADQVSEMLATASLTFENWQQTADALRRTLDHIAAAQPHPGIITILHDGKQVVDMPECYTIGGVGDRAYPQSNLWIN